MSIDALRYAFDQRKGLSPTDKLVLIALAWHVSEGEAYPRVIRLQEITLLSETAVRRSLKELKKAGLIRQVGKTLHGVSRWEFPRLLGEQMSLPDDSGPASGTGPDLSDGQAQPIATDTPGVSVAHPDREVKGDVERELLINTYGEGVALGIEEVWSYWLEKRRPRRTELEESQARLIAKALGLVSSQELRRAIDGLLSSEWHRDNKRLHLSSILATRPGGPTLRDQIDGFIERAPATSNGRSEYAKGLISRAKREIMQLWPDRDRLNRNPYERQAWEQNAEILERYGIQIAEGDERPVFEETA